MLCSTHRNVLNAKEKLIVLYLQVLFYPFLAAIPSCLGGLNDNRRVTGKRSPNAVDDDTYVKLRKTTQAIFRSRGAGRLLGQNKQTSTLTMTSPKPPINYIDTSGTAGSYPNATSSQLVQS